MSFHERAALLGLEEVAYSCALENGQELPVDAVQAIGLVLGIYRCLNTLFPCPDRADVWVRRTNDGEFFAGKPALDLMLTGKEGLVKVLRYLSAQVEDT